MKPSDIHNNYRKLTGKPTMGVMPFMISNTTEYVIYLEKEIIRLTNALKTKYKKR